MCKYAFQIQFFAQNSKTQHRKNEKEGKKKKLRPKMARKNQVSIWYSYQERENI